MLYSYATNTLLTGPDHQIFSKFGDDFAVISLNKCDITDVEINGYWRGSRIDVYNLWSHMVGDNFVMNFKESGEEHILKYYGSGHYELDGTNAKLS